MATAEIRKRDRGDIAALNRTGFSRLANAISTRRRWFWPVLILALGGALAAGWFSSYGAMIRNNATAGTGYLAHVACSCRYIAGRSLEDCEKDKMAGMELIRLKDDPEMKTVTASVPMLARDSATFREGYGCLLRDQRSEDAG